MFGWFLYRQADMSQVQTIVICATFGPLMLLGGIIALIAGYAMEE